MYKRQGLPFAGRNLGFGPTVVFGPVSHALGSLAALLGASIGRADEPAKRPEEDRQEKTPEGVSSLLEWVAREFMPREIEDSKRLQGCAIRFLMIVSQQNRCSPEFEFFHWPRQRQHADCPAEIQS